jgi:hypothetical protein
MIERGGELVKSKELERDEASIRKVLRIEPYGSFKKGARKPQPVEASEIRLMGDAENVKFNDAVKEAERRVEKGVNPQSIVSIILQDEQGKPGREQHTTLEELLQPKTKSRIRKDLSQGGWITFGGGGGTPSAGPPEGGGSLPAEQAASTLMKLAGVIAEKAEREPERRGEYGRAVADIVNAVSAIFAPPGREGSVSQLSGGDAERGRPLRAFKGPTWYQLDETSKLAALWWYENVKWRGQYAYVGELIGYPWGPMKEWKDVEKRRRRRKKYTKLEKLLDIFTVNIEDVFEIDKLSAQEIFELEDYTKKHPTERQYMAMVKLMKEEGYVEQRQFISSVEISKKFQPSDVYYPR